MVFHVHVLCLPSLTGGMVQMEPHQGSNSDASKEAQISAGCLERLHIQIAFLLHNTLELNTLHTTFVLWMLRGLSAVWNEILMCVCVCACHTLFSVCVNSYFFKWYIVFSFASLQSVKISLCGVCYPSVSPAIGDNGTRQRLMYSPINCNGSCGDTELIWNL